MTTLTLKYSLCSVVLGVALLGPIPAQADAKKEVLAAAREIIEAANAGDRDTMKKLHENFHSAFGASGGLLTMPRDKDETNAPQEEQREVTWRFSHWKHREIYVNGNMAFLTGYLDFTREIDGETETLHWRDTCIFEKRDGRWVRIHHHTSPLILGAQ